MDTNKKFIKRTLRHASQAEILRSHQRDNDIISIIRDKLEDVIQNIAPLKSLAQFTKSDIPVRLLYFIFTSGMGNQTLGEEYTGIIQANIKAFKIPSLMNRVLAALLECLGERTLLKMLEKLQIHINTSQTQLTPTALMFLDKFISRLRTVIPTIILLHRGLFYIYGRYYSLGRRIAGIDYAKVYGSRPANGVSWGLRVLGIATIIQCALKIWQSQAKEGIDKTIMIDENPSNPHCQLCLESLSTTVTLCGHLFCWNCIGDWLRTRPHCPLCREYVTSSRIVHLMNL